EECRRDRDGLVRYEREVQREMVTLQPPAPRRARTRGPEHRDRVVLGIAEQPPEGLELAQHRFQANHVDRLAVAHAAEARLHQRVRGGAGRRGHRLEGQALTAAWYVVPVEAFLVFERE